MTVLLFDLDGTLVNPEDGITRSIAFALEKMGYVSPARETLGFVIGPPLRESLATLMDTDDATRIEQALATYRERYAAVGLYESHLYPGIADLLSEAKARGLPTYVATSKPIVFARRILAHLGIADRFDGAYGAELDGRRDDKAELLAHLLSETGLAPDECTMVGDRKHDVVAARNHGMRAIGVTWGFGSREELEAAGAHGVCDEPGRLLDLAH